VEWIRRLWPGKLIIKGILDAEDARLAAASGASALVVSNHGGRQLDGAPSSIAALPKIVEAVGGEVEVMFDGGIRTGQDMMRALALASPEVAWLRTLRVAADGTLEPMDDPAPPVKPVEILEGRVMLLAHLLGLLVAFIGESLTLRLLHEIWPQLPLKSSNSNNIVNDEKQP